MKHRVTKTLRMHIARWLRTTVPSPCLVCTAPTEEAFLCTQCRHHSAVAASFHEHSISVLSGTLTVVARGRYWDLAGSAPSPAARLLHRFKYARERAAGRALARLLAEDAPQVLEGIHPVMVPIPLHRRRLRSRGFNQAAWLARELARRGGGIVDPDALVRPRDDPPRPGRTADERRTSTAPYFVVRRCPPPGSPLLLVDDVCTTGSTLAAAADALTIAGAVVRGAIVLLLADRERRDDTRRTNGMVR